MPTAVAIEVPGLYTAQVALQQGRSDARAKAYESALAEVLLRVSGSELASDPGLIQTLFPDPASFVLQFRPGEDNSLWVTFDGDAIERVLRETGQTVWGHDRPVTLLWLAVDWGGGKRQIIAAEDPEANKQHQRSLEADQQLREDILDMARRRGLPVIFPLMDTVDQRKVSFSDIWGGFDQQLRDASKRYETQSILVGRLRPDSNRQNRWDYYFADEQRGWTGSPEAVLNMMADQLSSEFAIRGDAATEVVELAVSGIDSVDDYGSMQNMLASTSVIDNFTVSEVAGDRIRYRVEARGGIERLRRALRFNGLIEQNDLRSDEIPSSTPLEFFYSPN